MRLRPSSTGYRIPRPPELDKTSIHQTLGCCSDKGNYLLPISCWNTEGPLSSDTDFKSYMPSNRLIDFNLGIQKYDTSSTKRI